MVTLPPQTGQDTVGLRIGRHFCKYLAAAAMLMAEVIRDRDGVADRSECQQPARGRTKKRTANKAYLLRTNCEVPIQCSCARWCIQLTGRA